MKRMLIARENPSSYSDILRMLKSGSDFVTIGKEIFK
tara:strand:+ start:1803 stop:1913 length:111 start_codon:yes stop_codon:yes gene_type:complete